jgi:hypothetical protein
MAAFRKKEGITNQAIGLRSRKIRKAVPMPAEVSTYVAAFEAGVDLNKHLTPDEVRNVAVHVQMVQAAQGTGGSTAASKAPVSKRGPASPRAKFKLPKVTLPTGTLSESKKSDALRMAERVYQLIYVFENSVREFVDGHLTAEYGKDWWNDRQIVSKAARDIYERNKGKQGRDRWVERKTARPIYYTELSHLRDIIGSDNGWKVFRPIFNEKEWVKSRIRAFESPRNVVAHMNPLAEKNIRGLEVRAQEWFDQIKDHPVPE